MRSSPHVGVESIAELADTRCDLVEADLRGEVTRKVVPRSVVSVECRITRHRRSLATHRLLSSVSFVDVHDGVLLCVGSRGYDDVLLWWWRW